jgi:glycosyltransferase involved in cell wall biosynthesis
MKITVVTPCRNAVKYIDQTVESVLSQRAIATGRVALEYIVCDGASTDGTLEALKRRSSPLISVVSEPDRGMYDALVKGLRRATGDVVAYLNAGDYYHPHAFDVVADVLQSPSVSWLTGLAVLYNEAGAIVNVSVPFKYRSRLFECGAYGRSLPFLMQEATFWRRQLHDRLDYEALAKMRYAGDYLMWKTFARHAELHIVQAVLGGFRKHPGQLSEDLGGYFEEVRRITRRRNPADIAICAFDQLMWRAPARLKKAFNSKGLLRYDAGTSQWR